MKKYLLDTHTLIWFLEGDGRLSKKAKNIIEKSSLNVVVSIISIWEIAIKISIGKLEITNNLKSIINQLEANNILDTKISSENILEIINLPLHHKDPFDRLLIAKAKAENYIIITKDQYFSKYDIEILW